MIGTRRRAGQERLARTVELVSVRDIEILFAERAVVLAAADSISASRGIQAEVDLVCPTV